MLHAISGIARFTLLEGWRTRLPWFVLALLGVIALTSEFGAALAITDSASYRTGVYAALARVGLVFVMVLFVVTSIVRELDSRLLDLSWSAPLPRVAWYGGRLAGFLLMAWVFALAAGAPLMLFADAARAGNWTLRFGAELSLLTAAALTAAVSLRQVTAAVTACGVFYILARAIDAIVLMSRGPLVDPGAITAQVLAQAIEGIALLLPALDRYAGAGVLLGDSGFAAAPILVEAVIYILLLAAVGLVDIYRHDG